MAEGPSLFANGRPFVKMQGLGNDFVVFDAVDEPLHLEPAQVRRLADRRFGIGCDQLLLLEAPRDGDSDFHYRVFNADGGEVSQCGNGARCVARLAVDSGRIAPGPVRLATRDGLMVAEVAAGGDIRVNMGVPRFSPKDLPARFPDARNPVSLPLAEGSLDLHLVSMGNPHAVIRVENVDEALVETLGRALETHPAFPERVNVGFLEVLDTAHARLRVWERGAGETLACGSGACAAMAAGRRAGWFGPEVKMGLQGGNLVISFESDGGPLWMQGPAEYVFRGSIRL
ncbi:diaminopimelate epimerase [Natronospira bacteriovora]|uniref:Diaminopimelate epimerase n=1 Tax=Natronospira bacteriovora TaxID=3069753 RepID=A0ABU0W748_9GAMM|nr:diaminopimelate epimerase [Natronospira sp. AB-CW4]MDQ2069851.1 diaminopimelate epimerase [Natronospira sp. AB-CW4]